MSILLLSRAGTSFHPATHTPLTLEQGDNCANISSSLGYLAESDFETWNVGVNCNNITAGDYYCVADYGNNLPLPSTVSELPSPVQSGITPSCTSWYLATFGDTCDLIPQYFGTFSETQFFAWNPALGGTACTGLVPGDYYCVAGTSFQSKGYKIYFNTLIQCPAHPHHQPLQQYRVLCQQMVSVHSPSNREFQALALDTGLSHRKFAHSPMTTSYSLEHQNRQLHNNSRRKRYHGSGARRVESCFGIRLQRSYTQLFHLCGYAWRDCSDKYWFWLRLRLRIWLEHY
jgi:hypothetical protein